MIDEPRRHSDYYKAERLAPELQEIIEVVWLRMLRGMKK